LGLVAGLATTASAIEFSLKGKYVAEGYYLSDTLGTTTSTATTTDSAGDTTTTTTTTGVAGVDLAGGADSDAYYMHTFQLLPTMKVNDKISMSADVRIFKEAMWGTGQDDGVTDVDFDKVYMDYASPLGNVRVGRVEAAVFGGKYLDSSTSANRIMWWPSFMPKPFSLLVFLQKGSEADAANKDVNKAADNDNDVYKLQVGHKSDKGQAAIEFIHNRNATVSGDPVNNEHVGVWGKYKLGNFSLEAELAYKFGEQTSTIDWDAFAGMVDVTTKFGALTPGLMYFYAQGDDDSTDNDNNAAMKAYSGTGDDFKPLYILTGDHTGILNNDLADFSDAHYGGPNMIPDAGVHAIVLHAKYKASDKLTLSGAVAYAMADKEKAGWDDEYGIEYNVGAAYKLLDNLTYEAHFGFLDTGDFFLEGGAQTNLNDITLVSHHLTMSF
jgi:hypothetical protein